MEGNSQKMPLDTATARAWTKALETAFHHEDECIVSFVFGKEALYDLPEGDSQDERRLLEKQFLSSALSLNSENIIFLKQVHGDRSFPVDRIPDGESENEAFFAEGDALFTNKPGVVLVVRTADCLPVFFRLQKEGNRQVVVGIAHAGWRGLQQRIIEKTLYEAIRYYFPDSRKIMGELFIGPGIGADSYEVEIDVAKHFQAVKQVTEKKYLLDLRQSAFDQIQWETQSTIGTELSDTLSLEISPRFEGCTFLENERFFSHRKGDPGRNLNGIYIKPSGVCNE